MPTNSFYTVGLEEGETVTIAELDAIELGFFLVETGQYRTTQNLSQISAGFYDVALTNIGIGLTSYATVGTVLGNVATGNHSHPLMPPPNNLSELTNLVTARSNLGLGDSAVLDVGTTAGTVAASDHIHAASDLFWDNTGYTTEVPSADIFTALQNFEISMFTGDVVVGIQEFLLTTYPATISTESNINVGTQNFELTTYPADIIVGFDIPVANQAFLLTTYPATIDQAVRVDVGVQEFVLTTYRATIT